MILKLLNHYNIFVRNSVAILTIPKRLHCVKLCVVLMNLLELFHCEKFGSTLTNALTVLPCEVLFRFDNYSKLERVVVSLSPLECHLVIRNPFKKSSIQMVRPGYTELL